MGKPVESSIRRSATNYGAIAEKQLDSPDHDIIMKLQYLVTCPLADGWQK
jgi:hypothetical protein